MDSRSSEILLSYARAMASSLRASSSLDMRRLALVSSSLALRYDARAPLTLPAWSRSTAI